MDNRCVLVIDDDLEIQQLIKEYLEMKNLEVICLTDGSTISQVLSQRSVDLIILDIMLPGEDGFEICSKIRKFSNIPIIMLTACGEEADRIIGLEIGADDYIPKPFSLRELFARVKALFRRISFQTTTKKQLVTEYQFLDWKLDITKRQIHSDQAVIPLSDAEYRLLVAFLQHPNRVLSRDRLLDLTHGQNVALFDRTIDIQISRLRSLLKDSPKKPEIIKTIRSEGYFFIPEVVTG